MRISQLRGLSGHAVGGPEAAGGEQRLLHRVLGDVEAAETPHQRAEHLGASTRSRCSMFSAASSARSSHAVKSSPMIGRISIGPPSTSTIRETISTACSWPVTSMTGGSWPGPPSARRTARRSPPLPSAGPADRGGDSGMAEALAADELTGGDQLLLELLVGGERRQRLLRRVSAVAASQAAAGK